MKKRLITLLAVIFSSFVQDLVAQGTAFTYQGQLQNNGSPASGIYDLTFALVNTNDPATAQVVGGIVTNLNVSVSNGLFTTTLDFGPVFGGNAAWLAVGVRTHGGNNFNPLTPWQALTPTPYALFAPSAGMATTASWVAGSNIVGTLAVAQLPANVITNGQSGMALSGTFNGNGAGLTNLTATALAASAYVNGPAGQTNIYASHGVYPFTVPPLVHQMVVKLWGAAGGSVTNNYGNFPGGAGAFSQATLAVNPGENYVLVVGEAGKIGHVGGGQGDNDASGGTGVAEGSYFSGAGGQGSSLFQWNGSNYIMKAVAGGGAGAGIISAGQAGLGQAVNAGAGYADSATTTGEPNLSLMGGTGSASGTYQLGGGGGGFGGGSWVVGKGFSGGGSYGDLLASGTNDLPGNLNDPNYLAGAATAGNDGLGVVLFATQVPVANLAEVIQAIAFAGNGAGLTNLGAANLTGTLPFGALPTAAVTNYQTGVTLSGTFGGTFNGNGAGLTNLVAANLTGPLPLGALPTAAVTNHQTGVALSGAFSGDGSGLTSLPSNVVKNNATGVTLGGAFSGDGSGLTSLPANAALRAGGNTFSGNQIFTNGSVGIGTTTPGTRAVLEVVGTRTGLNAQGYEYLYPGSVAQIPGSDPINTSIYASGCIVGFEVFAFSDARVKNIIGVSDGARDLDALMGIQVTDYTYKDTVAHGDRAQKKVIAQQVEQAYPQAVKRTTDVVPDIYRKATMLDGWVQLATDLKVGERVKLISDQAAGLYPVLAVRPGAFQTACPAVAGSVFVYGREVKDFHTVDYDAIAMLNVSATQELNRRVQAQAAALRSGEDKIAALTEANQRLETELANLQKAVAQLARQTAPTVGLNQKSGVK